MTSKYKIILSVLGVVLGYLYTQIDWESRAVRNQLNGLINLVEKDGAVSTFEAVGRSRKLTNFFAEDASVEYFPGRRLPKDLDAMSGAFLSVWGNIDKANVRVTRHEVEVDESEAESLVTASCSVIFEGSEQMGDTIKYRINWIQVDGDWLITSVIALGSQ